MITFSCKNSTFPRYLLSFMQKDALAWLKMHCSAVYFT
uniref:Uncharacterized protein n=1 Tax=Rhizophora mucronata TaxID=61149 RepID=A0A2P2NSQ1_RHIMU